MHPVYWYFGDFRLDAANACLWRGEERLALRPKTFAILIYLVTHADELVTKEALLDAVWPDTIVSDGVLKTSIRDLRYILGEKARTPQFIATEHRRGYRFIAPVTTVDPDHIHTAAAEPPPQPIQSDDAAQPLMDLRPATRIVARETELARLHQGFTDACHHEPQLIFVTGEAGIGDRPGRCVLGSD